MQQRQLSTVHSSQKFWQLRLLSSVMGVTLLLNASPAMSHHAMDGTMPSNFWEGFVSGLAHPVIGPDHFAFIVAVGLIASVKLQGILIPIAFTLSAMLGTGLHLLGLNVPGIELLVSGSILLFGLLLVMKDSPNTITITALASIAGLFHGYAYGESIFGAQMPPLIAYLIGFTVIQSVLFFAVFSISKAFLSKKERVQLSFNLRSSGFVLCGMGIAFLASQVMETIISLPKG